jgi:hypothetical protein
MANLSTAKPHVFVGGGFGGVAGFVDTALVGEILPTVRYLRILSGRFCPVPLMASRVVNAP